jgi:hypothetical protein
MNGGRIGLITRTPGEYEPSSIKLFVLDTVKQKIADDIIELADTWGDVGDAVNIDAWLFHNKKGELQSFKWTRLTYDHSVEDEKDTTVDVTDQFMMLGFSKVKVDTLSTDSAMLVDQFQHLLGK